MAVESAAVSTPSGACCTLPQICLQPGSVVSALTDHSPSAKVQCWQCARIAGRRAPYSSFATASAGDIFIPLALEPLGLGSQVVWASGQNKKWYVYRRLLPTVWGITYTSGIQTGDCCRRENHSVNSTEFLWGCQLQFPGVNVASCPSTECQRAACWCGRPWKHVALLPLSSLFWVFDSIWPLLHFSTHVLVLPYSLSMYWWDLLRIHLGL